MRWAMALADAVAVLDTRSEACIQAALPEQIVVTLPNMVEIDQIDALRQDAVRDAGSARGKLRLVFAGFVAPHKGVFELVEACLQLSEIPLEVELIGPYQEHVRSQLQSAAAGREDGRWLSLTGAASHEDVLRRMLAADIFVLPSRGESAPMVILEAMGCGKAIVTTKVGAIPEMLNIGGPGECGLVIPPCDVKALAGAIARLAAEPELRQHLGYKARLRAESVYSVPLACDKLLKLWKKVAAAP
jgi:glycosyltransferase involved in cell wall biosynthesis